MVRIIRKKARKPPDSREMEKNIQTTTYDSPCGRLLLGAIDGRLCLCRWIDDGDSCLSCPSAEPLADVLQEACRQLDRYFAGQLRQFHLPLLLRGTDFQQQAWHTLQAIPYGTTVTYGEEARRMGRPTALRAVGNANHCNPIVVIIPCHRVVAAGGKLGGYGGGLVRKRFLLALEARHAAPSPRF